MDYAGNDYNPLSCRYMLADKSMTVITGNCDKHSCLETPNTRRYIY